MNLLADIQASVIDDTKALAPIMLKLHLLAARLDDEVLGEWVKHESEGYPDDVEVPDYRVLEVSFTASFNGPFGAAVQNAQVPPYILQQNGAGEWLRREVRSSISAIDELISSSQESGSLGIDSSNLILLLEGKMYPDYHCNDVRGRISRAEMVELQHAVRARVLELTIQLDKSFPILRDIAVEQPKFEIQDPSGIQQLTQHVIYGGVTQISSVGDNVNLNVTFSSGDVEGLVNYLADQGIDRQDAVEFAAIMESETPESAQEPFGVGAKKWIAENLKKAAEGTWKAGLNVATEVLTEAALRYYDLK